MSANYRSQQQHAFDTCPAGPSLLRFSGSTVSCFVARSRSSEKPERTSGWLQAATARLVAWLESCADAYATAALYGELARLWGTARRACACIGQYVAECRDSYAAAVLYQELSKLSDAELERRGLARCDLHRNVFE